jgi:hypothetical protein
MMEVIEHFCKDDGVNLVKEISEHLENGGYLIGSSAFPDVIEDALELLGRNPFHKYIWLRNEFEELLRKYFREGKILSSTIFLARK